MIYYVLDIQNDCVKVGVTTPKNVLARMSSLKTNNPAPLCLIAAHSGSEQVERVVKQKLHPYRKRGEWFYLDQPVVDHVEGSNDFEYFFDVFEEKIEQGKMQDDLYARMVLEFFRHRKNIPAPFEDTLESWIEYKLNTLTRSTVSY